jgi:ubiquinone/menaquinone biosynthesis C-methylase UbiE
MAAVEPTPRLKQRIKDFWNSAPCGVRDLDEREDFAAHSRKRYEREPYIPTFADFASARGKKVLEIGVGMGADYLEWLRAGAQARGVDLSLSSLAKARRRCELAGFIPKLLAADAELLPFADNSFDIVYSYGVMHHSPNRQTCLGEAWRVLMPGGMIRIMLYHHPSLTGLMLWLRYGLNSAKSVRRTVYDNLESPGTKSFTEPEVKEMLSEFDDVVVRQAFSPGDLLLNTSSSKFQHPFYRLVWRCFPRTIARRFCRRLGLFLLISARKPLRKRPSNVISKDKRVAA